MSDQLRIVAWPDEPEDLMALLAQANRHMELLSRGDLSQARALADVADRLERLAEPLKESLKCAEKG